MLSLSKHSGLGLCARPFDKLKMTGLRPGVINDSACKDGVYQPANTAETIQ